jgi:hypothetical protein
VGAQSGATADLERRGLRHQILTALGLLVRRSKKGRIGLTSISRTAGKGYSVNGAQVVKTGVESGGAVVESSM